MLQPSSVLRAARPDPSAMPWLTSYPSGIDWSMPIIAKPVSWLIDDAVARFPNAPCVSFLGRTTSYLAMLAQVNQFAAGLQAQGVTKGTRVGLFLPNSPIFVAAYYGILKAGGTVVNFSPLYSVEELTHQVADSGIELMVTLDLKILLTKVEALIERGALARAIVADFAALLPPAKSVLFKVARRKDLADIHGSAVRDRLLTLGELVQSGRRGFTPVLINPATDLAVLQYTGGTTGTPKGAMLTHANVSSNVEQVIAWAGTLEDGQERFMGILPLFHVFAMTAVMNFAVRKAACMILVPKFEINESLGIMHRLRPTVLPGVPTLFNALLNHRLISTYDLSSLKFCISGGAALPLEVKHRFEARTGAKLVEGYGLSETSPVATCNPVNGPVKEGSIGQPLPGTIISIRAIDSHDTVMPLGESGEICIAGPQVMPGYWQKPEETEATFTGGFFRTGDVGYMDADGFTFIVDRMKDMINASGFKVYPRRIEDVLYEHPAVEEATVIGIPDVYRGEAPKAFVKLHAGMTASVGDLMVFLKPKLSKAEMPAEIEFRDSLPKTAVGKLSKKELKAEEKAKRDAQA
jgi:long-chain acyl-CoA synthetase